MATSLSWPATRGSTLSTPTLASWGCRPTVAQTPSWAAASSRAAFDCSASVPTVTSRATPAALASSTACGPNPFQGRWQWLSHHMSWEKRAAPLHRQAAGVTAPTGCTRQAGLGHGLAQPDPPPDLCRCPGERRAREHCDNTQYFERVTEDGVYLWARLSLPRLGRLERGVGRPD